MSTSFKIDCQDESTARAAVARLSTMSGADAVSVIRNGTRVELSFTSLLIDGLTELSAVIGSAFRSLTGRSSGLPQHSMESEQA